MLNPIWLLSLATTPIGGPSIPPVSVESRPRVEVWTDRGDSPYTSGQGVRTHFRADRDAFVTILRVDTDGRVRVLFPREPWEDNFARGGRDYEVQGGDERDAFYIDDMVTAIGITISRRTTCNSITTILGSCATTATAT